MTRYKIINGTDEELEFIYDSEIISKKAIVDNDGNEALMVTYHDDEFCINCTFVCDRLEKVE